MSYRVTTFKDALDYIGVRENDKIRQILLRLAGEGRSEKSIAYSIWREHDTILKFRGDPRFYSVLENSIRKWSWARDDPRWEEYRQRKAQEERAKQIKKNIDRESRVKVQKYPGYIYFIQGQTGGPVKIGYTTDVYKRLKALQTGYPDTLIIRCCVPGSLDIEEGYHEMFKKDRLKGEWFKPSKEVLAKMDLLMKCTAQEDKDLINYAASKDTGLSRGYT